MKDLKTLKKKIVDTTLFDDSEKVYLLADLDELSQEALESLETSIDDYTESLQNLSQQYKQEYNSELDKLVANTKPEELQETLEAVNNIKKGLNAISPK